MVPADREVRGSITGREMRQKSGRPGQTVWTRSPGDGKMGEVLARLVFMLVGACERDETLEITNNMNV